jgi:hypothetical protein
MEFEPSQKRDQIANNLDRKHLSGSRICSYKIHTYGVIPFSPSLVLLLDDYNLFILQEIYVHRCFLALYPFNASSDHNAAPR